MTVRRFDIVDESCALTPKSAWKGYKGEGGGGWGGGDPAGLPALMTPTHELGRAVLRQKNVSCLEVTVDELGLMEVLQTLKNRGQYFRNLVLFESNVTNGHEVRHGTCRTELHYDPQIAILLV